MATDATNSQLGFADAMTELSSPLVQPLPIFQAEFLAVYLAMPFVPPYTTLYADNTAALSAAHNGRRPPAWLPWVMRVFQHRGSSVRYVHTLLNPADLPSRVY